MQMVACVKEVSTEEGMQAAMQAGIIRSTYQGKDGEKEKKDGGEEGENGEKEVNQECSICLVEYQDTDAYC